VKTYRGPDETPKTLSRIDNDVTRKRPRVTILRELMAATLEVASLVIFFCSSAKGSTTDPPDGSSGGSSPRARMRADRAASPDRTDRSIDRRSPAGIAGIFAEACTRSATGLVRSSRLSLRSLFGVHERASTLRLTSGIICLMVDRSMIIDRDFPQSDTAVPAVGRSGRSTDESVRGTHRCAGSFYCDGYTRCRYKNAVIRDGRLVHVFSPSDKIPPAADSEIRQSRA